MLSVSGGLGHRLNRWSVCLAILCSCLLFAPGAFPQKPHDTTSPPNLPRLETADETNDRIAQLALAADAKQGDYLIGSGDLLGIEVFGVPEFSREVRVNESGFLTIPLVPIRLQAAGLTSFQLQDKLAELLQSNGLVNDPQVTVTVKERHSDPITVTGAVRSPQVIQAVRQMSLIEVLSQVGGLAPDASSKVLITRPSRATDPNDSSPGTAQATTITIDVNDLLDSDDLKFNVPVLGGDFVRVPRAGIVYAVGAVGHPAGYALQNDYEQMTALKLMLLAGGLTPSAKAHDAIILRVNPAGGTAAVAVRFGKDSHI